MEIALPVIGTLAVCCCISLCCYRLRQRRGRLALESGGLDPDELRFKRRLEAATSAAFEVADDDDDLELTALEVESIQLLERELKDSKSNTTRVGRQQKELIMAPLGTGKASQD